MAETPAAPATTAAKKAKKGHRPHVPIGAIRSIDRRGAFEGPLRTLIPVFIDYETFMDKEAGVSLGNMTLRQYLSNSWVLSVVVAIGDEDPVFFRFGPRGEAPEGLVEFLTEMANDPRYVFVAHNAAFDIRVQRFLLKVPQPVHVWCTMEGAMGAWPEMVGGYGLFNLGERLGLPNNKRKLDVETVFGCSMEQLTPHQLEVYNTLDVIALREVYYRQIAWLPEVEQRIALMTHRVRRNHMCVQPEKLDDMLVKYNEYMSKAESEVSDVSDLTAKQIAEIFNRETDDKSLRSVRTARLSNVIFDKWGVRLPTTSLKKLSPSLLAKLPPEIGALLNLTSRANKMLSHSRRSKVFRGVPYIDVELGYARAHTMRFSSPGAGGAKNLNLHNCVSWDTLIMTARGFVPVLALNKDDLIWDNTEFVPFSGVTAEGSRSTIRIGLAELTPEQPVLYQGQRVDAVTLTPCQQAVCAAAGFSSLLRSLLALGSSSVVSAAVKRLSASLITSTKLWAAAGVPIADLLDLAYALSPTSCSSSADAGTTTCSTGPGAAHTQPFRPSEKHALLDQGCAPNGSSTPNRFIDTSNRFLAGLIQRSQWIESTMLEGTSPGTSGSVLVALAAITAGLLKSGASRPTTVVTGTSVDLLPGTTVDASAVFDLRGVGTRQTFVANGILSFNCPKHDKAIAQPIRETFRVPDHMCLVRADLANVEFRTEGLITGAKNVISMFEPSLGGNIFNDPYCLSWKSMTLWEITKEDPVRQVAKSAVLGLGYCMSSIGYARVLVKAIADAAAFAREESRKEGKEIPPTISLATFEGMAKKLGWIKPADRGNGSQVDRIVNETGCHEIIALASYHIHKLFNNTYPEFGITASWLVDLIGAIAEFNHAAARDTALRIIDEAYTRVGAPDRDMIDIGLDEWDQHELSVRVGCGPWPRTVTWRWPRNRIDFSKGRDGVFENKRRLSIVKATTETKAFTKQLAIENINQAAARNGLCMGLLKLEQMGFEDILHIHDECMLLVPRTRDAVLKARDALLSVFGPKSDHPLRWAILINPKEITVTQSLWESDNDIAENYTDKKTGALVTGKKDKKTGEFKPFGRRWSRIEANEPGCLENLP